MSYGKIWVVKDHKNSNCEDTTKDLPLMIPIEIIDLALTMLKEKKSRKSELMKIILNVQEKNDQKVKELMQEEENKSIVKPQKLLMASNWVGFLYRKPGGVFTRPCLTIFIFLLLSLCFYPDLLIDVLTLADSGFLKTFSIKEV